MVALVRPERIGTYLRVVVTAQCPLSCSYCHMEGDPAEPEAARGLSTPALLELLHAALDCGVRKLKFVGGEPLIRGDLPDIIASIRARDSNVDMSVITSGAAPRRLIDRCFEAGLSRCNVTIHGFRAGDFARRGGSARHYDLRHELIEAVLSRGRPTKLNYVYTGLCCEADLAALLAWAPQKGCVLGLLDDLSQASFSHRTVINALRRLAGEPVESWEEPDPHSLTTLRLRLASGLVVEVKDQQLGAVAPWTPCAACPQKKRCREGIVALRLSHEGILRPCMDRPDLGAPLLPALAKGGREAVRAAWAQLVNDLEVT